MNTNTNTNTNKGKAGKTQEWCYWCQQGFPLCPHVLETYKWATGIQGRIQIFMYKCLRLKLKYLGIWPQTHDSEYITIMYEGIHTSHHHFLHFHSISRWQELIHLLQLAKPMQQVHLIHLIQQMRQSKPNLTLLGAPAFGTCSTSDNSLILGMPVFCYLYPCHNTGHLIG